MGAVTSKAGYGVDGSWGAGRTRRLSRRYHLADDLLGAGSGCGTEFGVGQGGGSVGEDGIGSGNAYGRGYGSCHGHGNM